MYQYLLSVYSDISKGETTPVLAASRHHGMLLNSVPERWGPRGMNYVDISMCYVFYGTSMVIILAVFYFVIIRQRLFLKLRFRSYKSAPSPPDHYKLNSPIY